MPFMFDSYFFILIIPALLFSLWAQWKVKSAYSKYAQVGNRAGLTGADVARMILRDADVEAAGHHVEIEPIGGQLSDHYDPRSQTLRLSQDVYHGRSIAALGIAAHEVGHAIQHARSYAPLELRSLMYPVSSLGSTLAFPLFFGGFIFPNIQVFGFNLMYLGILFFTGAVAFTVVTLPVEFNASRRAIRALANGGYLTDDEISGARAVLSAAALTYVASAAMAAAQLLRMILLANARD